MQGEIFRHIEANAAVRRDLSKRFDCSVRNVGQALNYERDSPKAQRIRKAAKNDGCIEYLTAPMCETIHDANGIMRQRFDNGAEIQVCKHGGGIKLFYKGEMVDFKAGATSIDMLTEWQERAAKLGKHIG